ncbi:Cytokinesis protein sepH [Leucoagaricus sp. SymC.cos]|nr:Cytokinesis protein sepH [Leucoagaricus sp. SymC.cos]
MENPRAIGVRTLKRSDPLTIQDKFLVQYMGWYACPGDGDTLRRGHHGWLQWFNNQSPDMKHPYVGLFPDVSSYSPSELYPVPGLTTNKNQQTFLFSSRNPITVQRHFHWMAEHGVDGAIFHRWAGYFGKGRELERSLNDEVMDHVREAAEKEGRVFAIEYSVLEVSANDVALANVLEQDWKNLVYEKGMLNSPNYLRENGKPVISLTYLGLRDAGHTPALVRSIVAMFRRITPGGAYIMGGLPVCWRTSEADADPNPEFVDIWLNEFDGICPNVSPDNGERMKADMEYIKQQLEHGEKKIDYIPLVFPGFSSHNQTSGSNKWNKFKRDGGRSLWKNIFNASRLGVRTMYGISWDDYYNGYALLPVVPQKNLLPQSDKCKFMALDEDGYDLPSDWYMRICGLAAEALHERRSASREIPWKNLVDYWANHPRHERTSIHTSRRSNISGSKAKTPNNSRDLRRGKVVSKASEQSSLSLHGSRSYSPNITEAKEESKAINEGPSRGAEPSAKLADDQFETSLQLLSRVLTQRASVGKRLAAIYLDQVLDEENPIDFEEKTQKRIFSLLSGLSKSAQVFPARCKLTAVQCNLNIPLHQGGFGYVCKGIYNSHTVCVKAVRLYAEEKASARFLRAQAKELILWSHLSHPNIIPFYGVWVPDETAQVCMVSPWMANGDLNRYLRVAPDVPRLPLVNVIHGLDYLHKVEIVHADLKAANVLVSDIGRAMLADFGISHIASTRLATTTIVSHGTPQWTAPELTMADDVSEPTPKSDMWSFGCVVYEVLTGNTPFHWYKTSHQILAAMIRRSVTPLQAPIEDGSSQIDGQLRNMMERCFNYVEKDRPTSGDIIQFFVELNIVDKRPLSTNDTVLLAAPKAMADIKVDYDRVYKVLRTVSVSPSSELVSWLMEYANGQIRDTPLEQDQRSDDEEVQ